MPCLPAGARQARLVQAVDIVVARLTRSGGSTRVAEALAEHLEGLGGQGDKIGPAIVL